ncbi:MAG: 50S ribosome-binding GTPase [Planctomycetes bacterium]|nr:50S ribosome-binding GTPase [Planctomycetota bacterium]
MADDGDNTTLAWLASPPGKGGIAIIILAGPDAEAIFGRIFKSAGRTGRENAGKENPTGSGLLLGEIFDGNDLIDQAVVCRPSENVVEVNIHGGPVVAARTLQLLAAGGAKVADHPPQNLAGALTQSYDEWRNPAIGGEMLAEINNAQSSHALACLCGQWSGGLSRLARQAISAMEGLAANSPTAGAGELAEKLEKAAAHLAKMRLLLKSPEVVLAGAPNSGKSTLANLLVGRPVSIVHHAPGTTRDWVRQQAVLDGVPIYLTDTAGIWDASDGTWSAVEKQAVRRAHERIAQADLVLLLHSADSPADAVQNALKADHCKNILRVRTKSDLHAPPAGCDLAVSAVTGTGIESLKKRSVAALGLANMNPAEPMAFTGRQANLLLRAAKSIRANRPDRARGYLAQLLEG